MASVKTKIKVELPIAKRIKEIVDMDLAKKVGTKTVGLAKREFIAKGISPVKGFGRFPAYARQRKSDPSKYPAPVLGRFPGKKDRPVNLRLDGSFMKHFTWWLDKKKINVGMSGSKGRFNDPPTHIIDMFETHNDGTQAPTVPQRKFLPNKDGEDYKPKITVAIRDEFDKKIKQIIEKSNNRG
jgi:hypothetical protein